MPPEALAAVELVLAREGGFSAVWLSRIRAGLKTGLEAVSTVLTPAHTGWGPLSPSSVEPGSSPGLLPSHQLSFPVPTDPEPAVNTEDTAGRWIRCGCGLGSWLELGGARQAGPSSHLEEFLIYPLARDQRPELAWARPAGWNSKEPPGSRPYRHFLPPYVFRSLSALQAPIQRHCQPVVTISCTLILPTQQTEETTQDPRASGCSLPDSTCHLLRSVLDSASFLLETQIPSVKPRWRPGHILRQSQKCVTEIVVRGSRSPQPLMLTSRQDGLLCLKSSHQG